MTFEELKQGFQRVQDLRAEADAIEKGIREAIEAREEPTRAARQKGKAPVRDAVQVYFEKVVTSLGATVGMVIENTGQKAESVRTAMNQLLDWGWLESFESAGQTLYRKTGEVPPAGTRDGDDDGEGDAQG